MVLFLATLAALSAASIIVRRIVDQDRMMPVAGPGIGA